VDQLPKKNTGVSTFVKNTKSADVTADRTTTTADKSLSDSAQLIPGQLTVRRLPRIDIDKMMMEGIKEMDVIWHSASEAAEAMRQRPKGWEVAKVMDVVNRATKKFIANTATRQQMKMLQQMVAAGGGVKDADVPTLVDVKLPVNQLISSQSCRTDLLKHLLSSRPPQGVNNTRYECCSLFLYLFFVGTAKVAAAENLYIYTTMLRNYSFMLNRT